jgi:hypothetical protein
MNMASILHFTALRGILERDAPLARYTSWRCGGPADLLYRPAGRDDLATFVRQLPPATAAVRARASAATRSCATAACAARSSCCTIRARRSPVADG